MTNRWDNYSRPTGGAEMAIGDGAALMGADTRPELRRAIENAARELKAADQVGHTYAWYVLEGAIDVAVLRESRAREVRDEALGKAQGENEQLTVINEKLFKSQVQFRHERDQAQGRIAKALNRVDGIIDRLALGATPEQITHDIRSALAGDTPEADE